MKTILKYALAISLLGFTYYLYKNRNVYTLENTHKLELGVGGRFTLQFHSFASGYERCWMNEFSCRTVKFIKREYSSSFREILGCNGCGGTTSWTFEGTKAGTDTIRLCHCPTGRTGKDCSYFALDSFKRDTLLNEQIMVEDKIIVQVR